MRAALARAGMATAGSMLVEVFMIALSPVRVSGWESFAGHGERGAVIGDEDGEQARRLCLAGIDGDEVHAARRLEEALAGLVLARRAGGGILRTDGAGKNVGIDAAGMVVHR